MIKWIMLIVIIMIPIVIGVDTLTPEDIINNTHLNITIYIDQNISFNNLYDNSSGIFFENLTFDTYDNCGNVSFISPNYIVNATQFPLQSWSCYPPTASITRGGSIPISDDIEYIEVIEEEDLDYSILIVILIIAVGIYLINKKEKR